MILLQVPKRIKIDKDWGEIESQALRKAAKESEDIHQMHIADADEESRTGNAAFHWIYAVIVSGVLAIIASILVWTA